MSLPVNNGSLAECVKLMQGGNKELLGPGELGISVVNIAVVAVARELAGFIWDISKLAMSLAVTRNEQPA
jgi:hypothetical protein